MAQVGLKNIYYAEMTSDTASATTYATPVKLGNAISVDMNPTVDKNTLYGDDMAVATNSNLKEITVTIETTEISLAARAALLGHEFTSDTLIEKSSDLAPYVALMFESETHDGNILCVKLVKGKFTLTQETINTRGETYEYQPPKLEGTFVSRQSDNQIRLRKLYKAGASTADWYTSV